MARIFAKGALVLLVVIGSRSELLGQASAYSPPITGPGADMSVSVTTTRKAERRSLSVTFMVPDDPPALGNEYTKISVYGYQMSDKKRTNDVAFPEVKGTWAPGSKASFSIEVPETYFAKGSNWEIHFCVGDSGGCRPSQNLLAGAS
jgi:hypothetical protein